MSKISTDDCKKFLKDHFPEFSEKGWSRVSKSKNANGDVVRVFLHKDTSEQVVVLENKQGVLSLGEAEQAVTIKSASKSSGSSKYIYSVVDNDINPGEPGAHLVMITKKSYFEKTGYMNDQPDYKPLSFFPDDWEAEDVNECGSFYIESPLDEPALVRKLTELGFASSPAFDQLVKGRSTSSPPYSLEIKAADDKKVIAEAVSESFESAPSAMKMKM